MSKDIVERVNGRGKAAKRRNLARAWVAAQSQSKKHNYPTIRKTARTHSVTTQPINVYVPACLDWDQYPQHLHDTVAVFADIVAGRQNLRLINSDGFVQLHNQALYNQMGQQQWLQLKPLIAGNEQWRHDPSFAVGSRSQGYRWAEPLHPMQKYPLGPAASKRLAALYQREQSALLPVHRHLSGWLQHLRIDIEHASDIINTLQPPIHTNESVQEYRDRQHYMVQRIADGQLKITVDKVGRVHTAVTNLHSALRPCLLVEIGGRRVRLAEIDLRNSQPLFAGLLCLLYHQGNHKTRHRLQQQQYDGNNPRYSYDAMHQRLLATTPTPTNPTTPQPPPSHIRQLGIPKSNYPKGLRRPQVDALAEFWRAYMLPALEGRVYETIAQSLPQPASRDKIKLDTLVTFYDCWSSPSCRACHRKWLRCGDEYRRKDARKRRGKRPLRDHLRQWVPPLYKMLDELKRHDHAHAALLMQNIEATVFIYRICGRMMRDHPDVPLFTLHDSLLVPPQFLSQLRLIIVDEFARIGLPLSPSALKDKYYE